MGSAGAVADPVEAGSLRVHRLLTRFALAAGTVFAWAMVFRTLYFLSGSIEYALGGVGMLYAVAQLFVFFLTPLTGAALTHGYQRALMFGTCAAALAFTAIALLFATSASATPAAQFWLVASFALFMAVHRALYFVPFSVAAEHAQRMQSPLGYAGEVVVAFAPFIGGIALVSSWLGAGGVFAALASLLFLALFPLLRMSDSTEVFEWNYNETFDAFFAPHNRAGVMLSFYDGLQGVALLLAWPLAVFLIVGQSFPTLGLVMSLTLLATLIVRRMRRNRVKRLRRHSDAVLAMLALSGWLARFFAAVPVMVVLVDVYAQATHSPRKRGIDTFVNDQVADGGHYIDEYTALREMGMALGRFCGALLLAVCAFVFSVAVALAAVIIVAGISAAVSVILSRRLAESRLLI